MSDNFTPITTQEEFDKRLVDRLAQKERSVEKKYEGFVSPTDFATTEQKYKDQIQVLNAQLQDAQNSSNEKYKDYISPEKLKEIKDEYDTKIAKYETDSVKTRIASEMGIPSSFISRLKGTTEDEIKEDAKLFAKYFEKHPPTYEPDPISGSKDQKVEVATRNFLKGLNLNKGE